MEGQLLKWSLGLMWGIWGMIIIIHMVYRRSWVDLLIIPVVQSLVVMFLLVIFESGWVVAGFILVANVAIAVYANVYKKKSAVTGNNTPTDGNS